MHPNQATLEKFYNAFAQLDADTMATCYAPDAQFDDEAFSLRGHGHRSCRKKSATAAANLNKFLATRKK